MSEMCMDSMREISKKKVLLKNNADLLWIKKHETRALLRLERTINSLCH